MATASPRSILTTSNAIHRHSSSAVAKTLYLHAPGHQRQRCSHCLHTNATRNGVLTRQPSDVSSRGYYNIFRHFSESSTYHAGGDDVERTVGSKRRGRIGLKCGRAGRKRVLKRRQREESASDDEAESSERPEPKDEKDINDERLSVTYHTMADYARAERDNNIFFGMPSGNVLRERYILSKHTKYPRTREGWKAAWERTWEKYLWTFEGFLIPEKKRDADGKIIPPGQEEKVEKESDDEEDKSLQEQATAAADQISQNVQKNISTIKEEAPKLLKMGQQVTGMSTKEELREWVGEQLKLGTECLSEFMKGYRKGRDDEVDRMLHEYFKEDEEKEASDNEATSSDQVMQEDKETSTDRGVDEETADGDAVPAAKKKQVRTWGRRDRRRLKSRSGGSDTDTSKE